MNNNSKSTETIKKAIQAYQSKFGKSAEQPHEAYCKAYEDKVILASGNNQLAVYNIHEGKINEPVGGFK